MVFLHNAKIRTKILSIMVPLWVLSIGGLGILAHHYKAADTGYSDFITTDEVAAVEISRLNRNLVALGYNAYRSISYEGSSPEAKAVETEFHQVAEQTRQRIDRIKGLGPTYKGVMDSFSSDIGKILENAHTIVSLGMKNQNDEAMRIALTVDKQIAATMTNSVSWNDSNLRKIADQSDVMTARTDSTIALTLGTLSAAFIAAIASALWMISAGIVKPMSLLKEQMRLLANGDTSHEIPGLSRKDELGEMSRAVAVFRENAIERTRLAQQADDDSADRERQRQRRDTEKAHEAGETDFAVNELANGLESLAAGNVAYRINREFTPRLDRLRVNFNQSMEKLEDALAAVEGNARSIDAGATEMRSSADDLAKRTEQQAASVEETAAALEEITTAVKDSARRAEEAGVLVGRARERAERSGGVVRNAVMAMQRIEQSSHEISNIIGVIDEIAFQTNLLALNAGVEAARAGDAGKGFAVVAQEVRELAQRSAKAAKEIKSLIVASEGQVKSGVEFVSETGRALGTIVTDVQEINRHVEAIVEASREQSIGLQEINVAVNSMDQGTQQNAAMVEEANAVSHTLSQDAVSLSQLMTQFKISAPHEKGAALSVGKLRSSPVRQLTQRVMSAFRTEGSAALVQRGDHWQEF